VSSPSQPEPSTGVLVIHGQLGTGDGPGLCARLRALLNGSDAEVIVCDVRALAADAVSVEALARLQLTALRRGRRIRLHRASRELDQLLSLVGLADVFGLGLGCRRQAEEREQPCRVEERVDRDDMVP
jgi:ABC-type transporter Mla MlaB component